MITEKHLTAEQVIQLSEMVAELLSGQALTRETVDELTGMLLEDVSGLECVSDTEIKEITNEIWQQLTSN